jgi:hypothetical protein
MEVESIGHNLTSVMMNPRDASMSDLDVSSTFPPYTSCICVYVYSYTVYMYITIRHGIVYNVENPLFFAHCVCVSLSLPGNPIKSLTLLSSPCHDVQPSFACRVLQPGGVDHQATSVVPASMPTVNMAEVSDMMRRTSRLHDRYTIP